MQESRELPARGRGRNRKKIIAALLWQIEWGGKEHIIIARSLDRRKLTPSLQNRPVITEAEAVYWNAFMHLTTSRPKSLRLASEGRQYIALDPIPISEISAYCDIAGIDGPSQRLRLVRIIQQIDAEYLPAVNPKVK